MLRWDGDEPRARTVVDVLYDALFFGALGLVAWVLLSLPD